MILVRPALALGLLSILLPAALAPAARAATPPCPPLSLASPGPHQTREGDLCARGIYATQGALTGVDVSQSLVNNVSLQNALAALQASITSGGATASSLPAALANVKGGYVQLDPNTLIPLGLINPSSVATDTVARGNATAANAAAATASAAASAAQAAAQSALAASGAAVQQATAGAKNGYAPLDANALIPIGLINPASIATDTAARAQAQSAASAAAAAQSAANAAQATAAGAVPTSVANAKGGYPQLDANAQVPTAAINPASIATDTAARSAAASASSAASTAASAASAAQTAANAAQATAAAAVPASTANAKGGYPQLDGNAQVPVAQINPASIATDTTARTAASTAAGTASAAQTAANAAQTLAAAAVPASTANAKNGYAQLDNNAQIPTALINPASAATDATARNAASSAASAAAAAQSAASAAQTTAGAAVPTSLANAKNGYAQLDANALVPTALINPASIATDSTARSQAASAVSTANAAQTAAAGAVQQSTAGAKNGYAQLDNSALIPTALIRVATAQAAGTVPSLGGAGGAAVLDASSNYAGQVGEAANPSPAIFAGSIGADPLYLYKNAVASQPCQAIPVLLQSGSGGICQDWLATPGVWNGVTDTKIAAAQATALGSNTVTLVSAPGLTMASGVSYLVIDMDATPDGLKGFNNGNIIGVLSSISGATLTLAQNVGYAVTKGDRILISGSNVVYQIGNAAAAVTATASSNIANPAQGPSITLSSAPTGFSGSAYAVDLDATSLALTGTNGLNTFGRYGLSLGQVTISGTTLQMNTPLRFNIAAGDRIALESGNGSSNGATAAAIQVINQAPGAIVVALGTRSDCAGFSVGCIAWGRDTVVQTEQGGVNNTLIGDEMQIDNKSNDSPLSYGFGAFNNGYYRNGPAFHVGGGVNGNANGGWTFGYSVDSNSNVSIADFYSGTSNAPKAFQSAGSNQIAFQGSGNYSQAFIDYTPYTANGYVHYFGVDPTGNIYTAGNATITGTTSLGGTTTVAGSVNATARGGQVTADEMQIGGPSTGGTRAMTIQPIFIYSIAPGQSAYMTPVGAVPVPPTNTVTANAAAAAGATSIALSAAAANEPAAGALVYDNTQSAAVAVLASAPTGANLALASGSAIAVASGDVLSFRLALAQQIGEGLIANSGLMHVTLQGVNITNNQDRFYADLYQTYLNYSATIDPQMTLVRYSEDMAASATVNATESAASNGPNLVIAAYGAEAPNWTVADATNPSYIPAGTLLKGETTSFNGSTASNYVTLSATPTTAIPANDALVFTGPKSMVMPPGLTAVVGRDAATGSPTVLVTCASTAPGTFQLSGSTLYQARY